MKTAKLILTITFLGLLQTVYCQSLRLISGTLVDASKMPIPGVSIVVKGTNTGVVTDMNGYYSIKAPLGAILVYSYIGFSTKEVTVTSGNSQPITEDTSANQTMHLSTKLRSSFTPIANTTESSGEENNDSIATAQFSSNSPTFNIHNPNNNWDLKLDENSKISSVEFAKDKVTVNITRDKYINVPHISFFSSTSVDRITKMPKRQDQFAQGRPINGASQWLGPETNEFLAWGPAIVNLEYDGIPNNFDKNGNLVLKGLGNGISANTYNPYNIFKLGFTFQNNLKISAKTDSKEYAFVYNNKQTFGVLPNSSKTGNYLEYKFNRKIKKLELKTKFVYDGYKSRLMSASPGLNLLMSSIETTPPTFDNANGFTRKKAISTQEAYQFSDNLQRTYAPSISNNPYWLINNMIDHEKNTVLNGFLESRYYFLKDLYLFAGGTIEGQTFDNSFGYKKAPNGLSRAINTARTDKLQTYKAEAGLKYQWWRKKIKADAMLLYNYTNSTRLLTRNDQFVDDTNGNSIKKRSNNKIQTIAFTSNLTFWNSIVAKFSQDFSHQSFYKNMNHLYSPSAGLAFNINEMCNLYPINDLKLRSTWGYAYVANLLSYQYGTYNYQDFSSSNYNEVNFDHELLPNSELIPEKIRKFGIGMDLGIFSNKLTLSSDVYFNKNYHGVFPRILNNEPILENLADYTTNGIELDLQYHYHLSSWHPASIRLIFTKSATNVTHLENNLHELPLGGFTNAHTALVVGQPKGVIIGTTYKRNEKGQLLIDNDGYPIIDETLHVLGNPNPKFTLGMELMFNFGRFSFTTLVEAGIGGERWNGTENALSYYGLSDKTIEGRKILEYIYPGVNTNGTPNTTPIDFANPSKSIEQNRWYRYGISGVAEDAMQDASYFRIKQITIGYDKFRGRIRKEILLFIENPLLLTKYKGVDPESTLWGKSTTQGLDMFNFPSISRIGINFRVSL